jgi:hypothetical protein
MPAQWKPSGSAPRSRNESAEKPLPDGCITVRDVLDEHVQVGQFRNIIGLVKDMRAPISTKGTGMSHKSSNRVVMTTDLTLRLEMYSDYLGQVYR